MKLHFSNDWLRRKITADPDSDPEAGPSIIPTADVGSLPAAHAERTAAVGERTGVQLRIGLGFLVHQLRCKEGLSIVELAERAQVSEDELRRVEHDPHYTARPRLIFQLSEYFSVSLTTLSQVAGATHDVDRVLYNEVVKYAAHSDDVSTLSQDQRNLLDAFVAMLNARAKA